MLAAAIRLAREDRTAIFVAMAVLLLSARFLGFAARRYRQPAVVGEILAGVLLGPTLLGHLAPSFTTAFLPPPGTGGLLLDGVNTLGLTLFLLAAGLESDFATTLRQGRTALAVSAAGLVVPFGTGFAVAWYLPGVLAIETNMGRPAFATFFATAVSISALPVIARILMDLGLYRTPMGMTTMAAAAVDDVAGWIVFGVILAMVRPAGSAAFGLGASILLTIVFAVLMLTIGRIVVDRALRVLRGRVDGALVLVVALGLASGACTEWIGVHALFGAYLAGVAFSDSTHLPAETHTSLKRFVTALFAPLFFASIGLKVDFGVNFDTTLVLIVLVVSCVGKIAGCGWTARAFGMPARQAWAIGFAMNARGAMEIVLALSAFSRGLIGPRMLVALVVMALVTSMLSGPAVRRLMPSAAA